MTLFICSIGGIASVAGEPAKVGVALFHVFFSLAFFVVTWSARRSPPTRIASEREGRTWEALLLTGLARRRDRARQVPGRAHLHLAVHRDARAGRRAAVPVRRRDGARGRASRSCCSFLFAVLSVAFGLGDELEDVEPAWPR